MELRCCESYGRLRRQTRLHALRRMCEFAMPGEKKSSTFCSAFTVVDMEVPSRLCVFLVTTTVHLWFTIGRLRCVDRWYSTMPKRNADFLTNLMKTRRTRICSYPVVHRFELVEDLRFARAKKTGIRSCSNGSTSISSSCCRHRYLRAVKDVALLRFVDFV